MPEPVDSDATPLRLRAEQLGDAFDLLAAYPGHGGFFLEREGVGVAASPGIADRALGVGPADEKRIRLLGEDTIRALRSASPVGAPALAVGAVGFTPGAGATMQVPGVAVRRGSDGATWVVRTVGDQRATAFDTLPIARGPTEPFAKAHIREIPTPDGYAASVAQAVSEIGEGTLHKVVLARSLEVAAGHVLDPRRLLHHLRAVEPHAYAFAVPAAGSRAPVASLVGASPELLVSRLGRRLRSNPLAGSAPRSGDPEEDREHAQALVDSPKDREEHAIVVDAMVNVLRTFCEELVWDPEPILHETANVWHLSTRFRGVLRDPPAGSLELVAALHPTPAVAGAPRAEALAAIRRFEPFDRGHYAGAVGWMDANGDGEWVIALRCAELEGDRATLYAGAGIVAASVPEREVDETERKFRAFLDALRWG